MKIGVVSDTHGLLRPEVLPALTGVDRILHLGDVGDPAKLAEREAEYKAHFANPFVAASRGYIDDVIMPHGTRRRIVRGLKSLKGKVLTNPWKKHDNIPL